MFRITQNVHWSQTLYLHANLKPKILSSKISASNTPIPQARLPFKWHKLRRTWNSVSESWAKKNNFWLPNLIAPNEWTYFIRDVN